MDVKSEDSSESLPLLSPSAGEVSHHNEEKTMSCALSFVGWSKFPLATKISSLEMLLQIIIKDRSDVETQRFPQEDDVLLRYCSGLDFVQLMNHSNPRVVRLTLHALIAYTKKTQVISNPGSTSIPAPPLHAIL